MDILMKPVSDGLMPITQEQRTFWIISLELKLRKCSGDSFQNFFSTMMEKIHGDDFIRIRPYGSLGDKGCDGYLRSNGQVFQCYGALNGDSDKVKYLISKMGEDFKKALEAIPSIMKEWHMVHNLVDGLPIEAVEKLKELENTNKELKFGFIGREGFEVRILNLPIEKIQDLLGPAATNQDAQNMQVVELQHLINAVANAVDELRFDVTTIRPVPPEKLDFNNLPNHWRSLIAGGWQNSHHVSSYFENHHDVEIGEKIAQKFRDKYKYLKNQNLQSGEIMSHLYEFVAGGGEVLPQRQVAVQALLAYLFENCDIFENPPDTAK